MSFSMGGKWQHQEIFAPPVISLSLFICFCAASLILLHTLGCEAKSEWEKWVVVVIADIHRELIHTPEPCPRKLPCEPIVTEEDIRYSLAFGPRKPGSHKGIYL